MYCLLIYHLPSTVLKKIDRCCADFFWKGKLHKVSWDILCKTKLEAGIGLQQFTDLNKTARIKLFWKLLASNFLCTRWMTAKYLSKENIWVISINNNYSVTMKSMFRHRGLTVNIMSWCIVNEKHTNLWYDPWISQNHL